VALDWPEMLPLHALHDYPVALLDCNEPTWEQTTEDPACACEQSLYWAQQQDFHCDELNILYFYHPDYLGSIEFVTDMRGDPYQFFLNTPWGENLENQLAYNYKSFSSRFRFNAKEWDEETGNYYYGARYYDPKVSVWLSVDPLATHSNQVDKSPYAFSWNNPINLVDPDGRCPDCPDPSGANEGDVANPNGTQEYIFTNGEWTGVGGILAEVEVGPASSSNIDDLHQMEKTKNTLTASIISKEMVDGAARGTQANIITDAKKYSDRFKAIPSGDKAAYKNFGKLRTGLDILGKLTGAASAGIAWYDYNQNPTTGNLIQATITTALIPFRINPVTGIIIGISDITGFSDEAFDLVGDNIDKQLK
jgi:RHS repeat-associated protein